MINRSEIIDIMKENEINISRDSVDLSIIKKSLENVLKKLSSIECPSDPRFILYGRMEFLIKDLEKNIKEKKYIDAYYNISDFLNDSRISLNNNPKIVDNNREYYSEDKICKEEQEILIDMINSYLLTINNSGRGNNMDKQEILKNICNDLNESIDNFEVSRLEEIDADLFTLKDNQRGFGGIIIGDDGSSLVCGSRYPISHYINEFKNKPKNWKHITKDGYHKLFETDSNNAFVRLIIPANEPTNEFPTELNLIGKLPQDFTIDEIIRMKKYSQKMHDKIVNDVVDGLDQRIQNFAKKQGYQKAVYIDDWNGYKCYEPVYDETLPSYTGLPYLILVDENGNIRMSTSDEAFQQIRDSKN